jgi:hypothetical protein
LEADYDIKELKSRHVCRSNKVSGSITLMICTSQSCPNASNFNISFLNHRALYLQTSKSSPVSSSSPPSVVVIFWFALEIPTKMDDARTHFLRMTFGMSLQGQGQTSGRRAVEEVLGMRRRARSATNQNALLPSNEKEEKGDVDAELVKCRSFFLPI